jgi:mono/diheme cytochrome c family protein
MVIDMDSIKSTLIVFGLLLCLAACADKDRPSYQYMPNMYEAVGYEAYDEAGFLPDNQEALVPPQNTIKRGWVPYGLENTLEGKEQARNLQSPLMASDSVQRAEIEANGSQLYTIYCAICHGDKGDGQGYLVQQEKILGVPSYADPVRNITVGTTYHTVHYGLNAMGSYASQMNTKEMWQVSEYVMQLKDELSK